MQGGSIFKYAVRKCIERNSKGIMTARIQARHLMMFCGMAPSRSNDTIKDDI